MCGNPCFYRNFRNIRARLATAGFTATCKGTEENSALFGGIASALLVLSILLLIGLIAAIVSCLKWKKRYEGLSEEHRPILPRTEQHVIYS